MAVAVAVAGKAKGERGVETPGEAARVVAEGGASRDGEWEGQREEMPNWGRGLRGPPGLWR